MGGCDTTHVPALRVRGGTGKGCALMTRASSSINSLEYKSTKIGFRIYYSIWYITWPFWPSGDVLLRHGVHRVCAQPGAARGRRQRLGGTAGGGGGGGAPGRQWQRQRRRAVRVRERQRAVHPGGGGQPGATRGVGVGGKSQNGKVTVPKTVGLQKMRLVASDK